VVQRWRSDGWPSWRERKRLVLDHAPRVSGGAASSDGTRMGEVFPTVSGRYRPLTVVTVLSRWHGACHQPTAARRAVDEWGRCER
jgi:hypothetical protein